MILHNAAEDSSIWLVFVNHVLFYPLECLKDPPSNRWLRRNDFQCHFIGTREAGVVRRFTLEADENRIADICRIGALLSACQCSVDESSLGL